MSTNCSRSIAQIFLHRNLSIPFQFLRNSDQITIFLPDYSPCSTMTTVCFGTVSVVLELLFFIDFKVIIYWGMSKIKYGVEVRPPLPTMMM